MRRLPEPAGAESLLRLIMIGILAWGAVHAVGAWTLNHDARRPLVVLSCVAAFLGFWLAMLSSRRRRLAAASGIATLKKTPLERGGDECRSRS